MIEKKRKRKELEKVLEIWDNIRETVVGRWAKIYKVHHHSFLKERRVKEINYSKNSSHVRLNSHRKSRDICTFVCIKPLPLAQYKVPLEVKLIPEERRVKEINYSKKSSRVRLNSHRKSRGHLYL